MDRADDSLVSRQINVDDLSGRRRTLGVMTVLFVGLLAACSAAAAQPEPSSGRIQLGEWTAKVKVIHVTDALWNLTCWSSSHCAALGTVNRTASDVLVQFNPSKSDVEERPLTGLTSGTFDPVVACTENFCLIATDQCEPPNAASGQLTTCTAVIARQSGDGWSIVFRMTSPAGDFSAISCSNKKNCVAVGTTPATTGRVRDVPLEVTSTDGGRHWEDVSESLISGTGLYDVACYHPNWCVAYSDVTPGIYPPITYTYASNDGGQSWIPTGKLTNPENPSDVSCSQAGVCIAPAEKRALLFAGDLPWRTTNTFVPEYSLETGGSCSNPQNCVVAASQGRAIGLQWTNDAGRSWAAGVIHSIDTPLGLGFSSIQCLSSRECLATDVSQSDGGEIIDLLHE